MDRNMATSSCCFPHKLHINLFSQNKTHFIIIIAVDEHLKATLGRCYGQLVINELLINAHILID